MSAELDRTLKKVAKGSTAVFGGTGLGMILALVWRLLVIRTLTPQDFGIFFLAISIINLLAGVSTLGLPDGVPRYIAYFRGKGENNRVVEVVRAAIWTTIIFSVTIVAVILILSSWMAVALNLDGLDLSLRIMVISIPFFAIAVILTSVFRAYGIVRVKIYFIEFLKRVFIFGGIIILILLGAVNLLTVSIVFSLSGIFVLAVVGWYYLRNRPEFPRQRPASKISGIQKELIMFSLPLLGMGFMDMIFRAIGPMVLGVFSTPDEIASFGAAITISALMGVAMTSLNFIYLPMMSDFFARNMKKEMRKVYSLVSKWSFFAMLIFLTGFILLSHIISPLLFRSEYSATGIVMTIQAMGFFSIYLFGPVRASLIVVGRPYFLILSSSAGLVLSFLLSILLVPGYGAIGASVSMSCGLLLMYGLNAIELQRKEGLNAFSPGYTKTFAGGMCVLCFSLALNRYFSLSNTYLVLSWILIIIMYGTSLFLMKAIEKEDLEMFQSLLRKIRRRS